MKAFIYFEGKLLSSIEATKVINDVMTNGNTEIILDGKVVAVIPPGMAVILMEEKDCPKTT